MKNVSEPKYLTDDIYTACLEISKNVTKDEWNKELFLVMIWNVFTGIMKYYIDNGRDQWDIGRTWFLNEDDRGLYVVYYSNGESEVEIVNNAALLKGLDYIECKDNAIEVTEEEWNKAIFVKSL